jgi:hypothetical protein
VEAPEIITADSLEWYDTTNQLTGDGTNTWSYDLNGNRTNTGYQTGIGSRCRRQHDQKDKGTNQET